MPKPIIELRRQRISDAKNFHRILDNDNFIYFGVRPETIEDQKKFLQKNKEKRKNNFEHNYSILFNKKLVGAIGIKINKHREHIGEIGYFIDEDYWGKGIATRAVKLVEKIGFDELGIKRMEIVMNPRNKASEKVAIKAGYKKEGLMQSVIYSHKNKEYEDCLMYAKVK